MRTGTGGHSATKSPSVDEGETSAPVTWLFEPETYAPLGKLVGDQPHAVFTDHLGTPVRMVDAQGDEIWAAEIDTFGALRDVRGEREACPFRWPGQYQDAETGLSYNRFRYYDPETGRYTSQDPIRLWGGMQLYAYPFDPLAAFDPLGLIPVYRLLRPDEDPSQGLNAKKPGRNMTVHGHVTSGSRNKGSQFISTSTDPDALTQWREPGQRMVTFDTDDVVPDAVGNRRVVDISTRERAIAAGVGSGSANIPARSREVLVEGHVPPQAIRPCP